MIREKIEEREEESKEEIKEHMLKITKLKTLMKKRKELVLKYLWVLEKDSSKPFFIAFRLENKILDLFDSKEIKKEYNFIEKEVRNYENLKLTILEAHIAELSEAFDEYKTDLGLAERIIERLKSNKKLKERSEKEKEKEEAKEREKAKLEKKIYEEIRDNVKSCKKSKEDIARDIIKLNKKYESGAITRDEYLSEINQKKEGRTKFEWLDFCNRYIDENQEIVDRYRKRIQERIYQNIKNSLPITILLVSLIVLILMIFRPLTIGLAPLPPEILTIAVEYNYTDEVNLSLNNSSEFIWVMGNFGSLKSVRLDGSFVPKSLSKAQTISKEGYGKVYLGYENKSYLIFDSTRLSKDELGSISGLAIGDINQSSLYNNDIMESESINNDSIDNSSLNNNKSTENKFSEINLTSLNKSIIITTQGGGLKTVDDVFEFSISSEFNWNVSENKLCTRWGINLEWVECYGSSECCNFLEMESIGLWNDSFYLSYGRYNSGLENVVSTQLIYYDVNLSVPYADIVYSDVKEVEAEFYEAVISFRDACIETCALDGFNASSYKLVFVVENGSLMINNIKYTIEKEINISRNPPLLVKEFENITIYKNESIKINLSDYFIDEDGDKLIYTVYKIENISMIIRDNILEMIPDYNFTGKRFMFITASDGYYNITSNIFSVDVIERPLLMEEVNITEEIIKPKVVINEPVRWIKKVNASASVINLTVNISNDALNVSVRDIKEDKIISEDKLKVNDMGVIKNASTYRTEKRIEQIEEIEDKLIREKESIISEDPTAIGVISSINDELLELQNERNRLTGYVIAGRRKGLLTMLIEFLSNVYITGYATVETENASYNITSIIIEDIVEEVEIEYYTKGPVSEEENIINGKRIFVSSDIHYEDILAYTTIEPEVDSKYINLYRIVNGSRERVEFNASDNNYNGLIDLINWVIPALSNETYELEIIVLNVQSYPQVGNNWTVAFTTKGIANLTIKTINGTTWSNINEDNDLRFLEIRCGNRSLDYTWQDNGSDSYALIINYECNETGFERSRVLTTGKHNLEFDFGGERAYANNYAGGVGDNVIQVYTNTFGQNAESLIAINFDGETRKDSGYTHSIVTNPERVYVNSNGLHKISYGCLFTETGKNDRLVVEMWVRKNGAVDIVPSKASCYIDGSGADGNRCSNKGTTIASLTSGEYIELMAQKLKGLGTNPQTTESCWMYVQRVNNDVAQMYDINGEDAFSDTNEITVSIDTETFIDIDSFAADTANNRIGVSQDGWYKIYYHVCSHANTQTNRQTPQTYIRKSGTKIMPSDVYSYIRTEDKDPKAGDRNCEVGYVLYDLAAGNYVDIRHLKRASESPSVTSNTLPGQSWLLMERINHDDVLLVYDTAGGQLVADGSINAINLDTNYKIGSSYAHDLDNTRIYVNRAGWYEVSYTLGWQDDGGNDEYVGCANLRKNGFDIIPSRQCDYSSGYSAALWHTVSSNVIVNFAENDYLELMFSSSGSAASTIPNSIMVTIAPLDTNMPPTEPLNIQCNGNDNCDFVIDDSVVLKASGSIDSNGDEVTYFIEALLTEETTSDDQETGEIVIEAEGGCSNVGDCSFSITQSDCSYCTGCSWDPGGMEATQVFYDGFESGGADPNPIIWDKEEGGDNDEIMLVGSRHNPRPFSGSYALEMEEGDEGQVRVTSKTGLIDLTGYDNCVLSFWVNLDSSWETDDDIQIDIYDGTWHNTAFNIDGDLYDDSAWHYFEFNIDSSSYVFDGNFRFRIDNDANLDQEEGHYDDVTLTCYATRPATCSSSLDCSGYSDEIGCETCSQCGWGGDVEVTKGWNEYDNIFTTDITSLNSLEVLVTVSLFDNLGSVQNGNNMPDLQLEMWDGSNWIYVGEFGVNGVGDFSLTVSDPSILAAWQDSDNTDLRIRGINFDYFDGANYDKIRYTNIFVTRNGREWTEIGSHIESGQLIWDVSAVPDQNCINLRARAIDLTGSNIYSGYFTKGSCLNINHLISIGAAMSDTLRGGIIWNIVSLPITEEPAQGNNGDGITDYYVSVSASGTTADLYIKASGDLTSAGGDIIVLSNERFSYSSTDNTVPSATKYSLTTNYADNKIGDSLPDGSTIYLKFFLDAPPGQAPGIYSNQVDVEAVPHGGLP